MWEFIDKIIYINLDHRQDRRDIMKKFFDKGNIPEDKVIRFSAIKRKNGALGCVESHGEVIKLAKRNEWKNVLILEDDLQWLNLDDGYKQLEELVKLPKWDIIQLVGWYVEYDFPRIYHTLNTGAYLVNSHYYDTILNNRLQSIYGLTSISSLYKDSTRYTADVHWNVLAKNDSWYGINPCICCQINTHSDISNKTYQADQVHGIYKPEDKAKFFAPI
jgi:glycosyl transferase family 25